MDRIQTSTTREREMRPVDLRRFTIAYRTPRHCAVTLALIAAALAAAPARGDNLDAALVKHAPEVMAYLRDHECQNVGVLKFRVHKGNQPSNFKVGPLNDNLPGRLENALIAANSTSNPVGIIHDASHVAAASRLPRYDNPAGQHALFGVKYPLAWGDAMVTPDHFLTGVVTVRPDKKSATVTIEAFGSASPKQEKVLAFQVATDRALLADLNESFQVKSRQLKRKTRNIDLDEDAAEDAASDETWTTGTDGPATSSTTAVRNEPGNRANDPNPIYYEIRYSGKAQPVTPDPANPGELHVPEPSEGQKVSFYLKTLAPERTGLVLMVNGKSTLYEEDSDPIHCKAWVLDPGREYEIHGFQQDNNSLKPFRVMSDEESAAATYSANTGLIQFHIFKSGTPVVYLGDPPPDDPPTGEPMNISLRGLNRAALVKAGHTRSLKDLQQAIRKHAPKKRMRGLIIGDTEAIEGKIENDEVKNPIFMQSICIRYYKPKGQ
jgi:hypothetical protein